MTLKSSLCENELEMLNGQKTHLEQLKLKLCQEEIEKILQSDLYQGIASRPDRVARIIEQNGSDLTKFWLTYLEICELLIDLISATKTGNWELYLTRFKAVIPWTFAYDRPI